MILDILPRVTVDIWVNVFLDTSYFLLLVIMSFVYLIISFVFSHWRSTMMPTDIYYWNTIPGFVIARKRTRVKMVVATWRRWWFVVVVGRWPPKLSSGSLMVSLESVTKIWHTGILGTLTPPWRFGGVYRVIACNICHKQPRFESWTRTHIGYSCI